MQRPLAARSRQVEEEGPAVLARTEAAELVRPGPPEPEELPSAAPALREQAPPRAGTEPRAGSRPHWQVAEGPSPPDLQGCPFHQPAERNSAVAEAFDAG